ncbi:MAG: ankyrin repeat domain-containing protein, partial [Magnetococcus sp. YQC-3]
YRHECGCTALLAAAEKGYTRIVQQLLDHGADINAVNNEGISALMFAARDNHLDTAKVLIERGIQTTITDKQGRTAQDYLRKNAADNGLNKLLTTGRHV